MQRKGNVSLAVLTRSLPESNTDAELKGGSEMGFFITMINIFSFGEGIFLLQSCLGYLKKTKQTKKTISISFFYQRMYNFTCSVLAQQVKNPRRSLVVGLNYPIKVNLLYVKRQRAEVKMADF